MSKHRFKVVGSIGSIHAGSIGTVYVYDTNLKDPQRFYDAANRTNSGSYFGETSEDMLNFSGEKFEYEGMLVLKCLDPIPPKENEEAVEASAILHKGAECIGDRASERDTDSERSMSATVAAFNAMYGKDLTEEQGWMFMVFLKAARAKGGDFRLDDYIDGSAYFALAGEARAQVHK
ncbi:HNH endonuclease [Vibrio phage vB_VhaP_PG11]|nr:HNH endonuclease [Vibrio phage vB_VhaP_PG11]